MLLADAADSWNWTVLLPVIAGGLAVWYMLPSPKRRPLAYGILAGVIGLAGLAAFSIRGFGDHIPETVEAVLFFGFSGLAVIFAVLMITGRNPARCALSFAVVILSTCGLFLLLAAPFLMAATIVIYAGAIIVTFLFVIMLSQQAGPSNADLRSREPELSVAAGFVLLAMLLVGLQRVYDWRTVDAAIEHASALAKADRIDPDYFPRQAAGDDGMNFQPLPLTPKAEAFTKEMRDALERVKVGAVRSKDDRRLTEHKLAQDVHNSISEVFKDPDTVQEDCRVIANGLAKLKALRTGGATFDDVVRSENGEVKPIGGGPKQLPAANVSAIGRTLFSDHLLAVELGGTLLLVATVGAIAIAGRRERAHG
jgi:NADH:ubiquinone oxidoreductase subunit 6 (subunit J)